MLHHEESPEKPHYNMATPPISRQTPPILLNPPFSSKDFQTPPISIKFEKVDPCYEVGGLNCVGALIVSLLLKLPPRKLEP